MNTALLTIDDVPSKNTPAIVDYLKEKGIQPILFATGENIERHHEEAMYAVKSGILLGNHSYSHRHFSEMTLSECIEEIERCEDVLDKLYEKCGYVRAVRPFRFPYGDKGGENRQAIDMYLREKRFDKVYDLDIPYEWWKNSKLKTDIDTFWTFDFEEYKIDREKGFTLQNVWDKILDPNPEYGAALFREGHRHILLMHAHDDTEKIVPCYWKLFLDYLFDNGIVFEAPRFVKA